MNSFIFAREQTSWAPAEYLILMCFDLALFGFFSTIFFERVSNLWRIKKIYIQKNKYYRYYISLCLAVGCKFAEEEQLEFYFIGTDSMFGYLFLTFKQLCSSDGDPRMRYERTVCMALMSGRCQVINR